VANGDAHVTYRDEEDKWAVDVEGAAWAASRHDKKERAERAGRAQAEENEADLIVHRKDGQIQERSRYKRDSPGN
jgi:hypothetical protein